MQTRRVAATRCQTGRVRVCRATSLAPSTAQHGTPTSLMRQVRGTDPQGPISILVIAGVSGSGKSTVARALAERLGWVMLEGDDFHPEANKRKMASGQALTDQDRWPWLQALRDAALQQVALGYQVAMSCSALKQQYRDFLRGMTDHASTPKETDVQSTHTVQDAQNYHIEFVLLDPDPAELKARLLGRKDHFMPLSLLESQLATLERGDLHEWLCVVSTQSRPVASDECETAGRCPALSLDQTVDLLYTAVVACERSAELCSTCRTPGDG